MSVEMSPCPLSDVASSCSQDKQFGRSVQMISVGVLPLGSHLLKHFFSLISTEHPNQMEMEKTEEKNLTSVTSL